MIERPTFASVLSELNIELPNNEKISLFDQNNPVAIGFSTFAKKSFISENLLFVTAIHDFNMDQSNPKDLENLTTIMNTYIKEDAKFQINISGPQVNAFKEALTKKEINIDTAKTALREILKEIKGLMIKDPLMRYKGDPIYKAACDSLQKPSLAIPATSRAEVKVESKTNSSSSSIFSRLFACFGQEKKNRIVPTNDMLNIASPTVKPVTQASPTSPSMLPLPPVIISGVLRTKPSSFKSEEKKEMDTDDSHTKQHKP